MSLAEKKEKKAYPVLPPIRCSISDKEAIKAKAKQAGLNMSEYIRRQSLDGKVLVHRTKQSLGFESVQELKKQGNNLNQLVKNMHIFNRVEQQALFQLKAKLDKIYDHILTQM